MKTKATSVLFALLWIQSVWLNCQAAAVAEMDLTMFRAHSSSSSHEGWQCKEIICPLVRTISVVYVMFCKPLELTISFSWRYLIFSILYFQQICFKKRYKSLHRWNAENTTSRALCCTLNPHIFAPSVPHTDVLNQQSFGQVPGRHHITTTSTLVAFHCWDRHKGCFPKCH